MRFYFHIDPDKLTDEEWADKVQQMWWALEFTGTLTFKKEELTNE